MIVIDEMAISAGVWPNKGDVSGYVTLNSVNALDQPSTSSALHPPPPVATKCLAALVAGVSTRFKHVIAYEFTAGALPGSITAPWLTSVHKAVTNLDLNVVAIISDMGNHGLWKYLGVPHGNTSTRLNDREVHMLYDIQHLLKNIRTGCLNFQLRLPPSVTEVYNLTCPLVDVPGYVNRILDWDDQNDLKYLPQISRCMVDMRNSHFDTMRVDYAQKVQ